GAWPALGWKTQRRGQALRRRASPMIKQRTGNREQRTGNGRLWAFPVLCFLFSVLCSPRVEADAADQARAARATEMILANDYDKARAELAKGDPNDPHVILAKARLALYEEDCDLSAALLARSEAQALEGGRDLADIARGCARVTAATVV